MKPDELRQLIQDYGFCFGTPSGERVLKDLARQCYEDAVTFVPGSSDGTAFNEGKRWVILHIRRALDTHPDSVLDRKESND